MTLRKLMPLLSTALLSWCSALLGAQAPLPLDLLRALPVEGAPGLQPSGLAFCGEKLLMVSDRHNHQVFELAIEQETARATPHLTLTDIPKPSLDAYDFGTRWWNTASRRYDWEGISCDSSGRVYLLSETLSQVLVQEPGGKLAWLGDQSFRAGTQASLFQQFNALAEGLAVAESRLLIAAERSPRGLLEMENSSGQWSVSRAVRLQPFPSLERPVDFSALWLEEDRLYTLERNHFQVCRRNLEDFSLERCWSYRHIEEAPPYAYQDLRFGKAEGIARRGDHLYLVLDNNDVPRASNPQDRRPWLFILKLPQDW